MMMIQGATKENYRTLLSKDATPREPTGLVDMEGTPIFTGDIVEFYFDVELGYSDVPDEDYTRMRDIVIRGGNGSIYFVCACGAAYASRHVGHCRVIGQDPALIDT